jgi:hypothetical protein
LAGRRERLAIEAHCRGLIDFSKDGGPYQHAKEAVIFEYIEDQLASEVTSLAHRWHSSAAVSDPWDDEGKTFEFHRKEVNKAYREVGKLKLPWYKRWQLDDAEKLAQLIRNFYAQEREPGFKEWREKTKQSMRDNIAELERDVRLKQEIRVALKKAQAEREQRARKSHERSQKARKQRAQAAR